MVSKHLITTFRQIISLFFIFTIISSQAFSAIVEFNSEKGLQRLEDSHFKNDFYQLVNYYQPQSNPLYCAVATGVMLLNALDRDIASQKAGEVIRPDGTVVAFHSYVQAGFLNAKTDKIKDQEVIALKAKNKAGQYDAGISLADFANILSNAYGLEVTLEHADDHNNVLHFRQSLKRYLKDRQHYMVANFDGKMLGLKSGGHISPIVAYDETSDSLLVMDVALHKNRWFWTKVEDFYRAMHSLDGDQFRGWLIVSA